jgi:DNA-binding beta-propeller fold protein YncE
MHKQIILMITAVMTGCVQIVISADEWWKPYSPPCTERENVFAFTEKPKVKVVGEDRYEISFAVKGYCDVAVAIVDPRKELVPGRGTVVRHLGAGVLGANAPAPFQKNSLKQVVYWDGKDDLGFYHKEPDKLQVRVMLGLKPVFDKRLGGTSPYNLPGNKVWGITVCEDGVYIFSGGGDGFGHCTVRKFDRDGNYVATIFPPPASLPLEKSEGISFIEYEPGKRTRHGRDLHDSIAGNAGVMLGADGIAAPRTCGVTSAGNKLFYASFKPGAIRYIYKDGATDEKGQAGLPFVSAHGLNYSTPTLTASPDGKWLYAISPDDAAPIANVVVRTSIDGSSPPADFIGQRGKPDSSEGKFNKAAGIDCDAQGRIYVSDANNNRIQVFSPEGKFLKAISIGRPGLLQVHKKTGAIYVQHPARVEGRSVARITKLASFDNPVEEFHTDGFASGHMALDSWSVKPRLWLANETYEHDGRTHSIGNVKILEEDEKKLKVIKDFHAEAKKDAGDCFLGIWGGHCFDRVICDPVREHAYYYNSLVIDLVTGKYLGTFSAGIAFDDMGFDKYGYLHLHFNPCFFGQGVGRVDPSKKYEKQKGSNVWGYPECPYDYGIEALGWRGILPVKDQNGAKGFQDGLGINMQGEIASECNIYFVPKWEDEVKAEALIGNEARLKAGVWSEEQNLYDAWLRKVEEARKRGEEVYYIKHAPGIPLSGGTVWLYNRYGELIKECAVIAGDLINGVQMDEDRAIYFVNARPKAYNAKPFLYGKAGIIGKEGKGGHPFTATLIKSTPGKQCKVLLASAKVPMEPLPSRPPDLLALDYMDEAYMGKGSWCWVENAEWIYAGAGPVTSVGCSCPRQNLGLDWYKRVYIPEAYRHSIGILDTNGNLIMHLGRYGNFDDAPGGKNGTKPGGEDIGIMYVRFISATDNYVVYGDWAEKLVSLRLTYHAEESVPLIGN